MKSPWLGPKAPATETETDRAARALLDLLRGTDSALMTKQLSGQSGLRPQVCSIALHTLRQLSMVSRTTDRSSRRQVWRWSSDRPVLMKHELREKHLFYSLQEASDVTGLSTKALTRRIERRKLACFIDDRRRFIFHDELHFAGLIGDTTGGTQVEHRTRQLIRVLARAKPGTEFTTAELQLQATLDRQPCEASLAVVLALGFVKKGFSPGFQQYTWSWVGPSI